MTETAHLPLSIFLGVILAVMFCQFIKEYAQDIRQTNKRKKSKRDSKKPSLSIIIQTQNDAKIIEASLKSIFLSNYRKFDVVIIDNASEDQTLEIIQKFQKRYPKRLRKVVQRRDQKPLPWRRAISRFGDQNIVLTMLEPYILEPQALGHIAQQFALSPQVGRLAIRTLPTKGSWLNESLGNYIATWNHRYLKGLATKNRITPEQEGIFAVRRGRISHLDATYNSKAIVYGPHLTENHLRPQLLSVLFCLLFVYTIITKDTLAFLYGWSLFVAFLSLSILGDTNLPLRRKGRQLTHIVPAYLMFCSYFISLVGKRLFIWLKARA